MLIALPTFSSGATVKNELRSFDSVQPRVGPGDPPKIKPPLHGTNPHGQGTAVVVDLSPDPARPYAVDERGNAASEDIIVGRSRGEQRADGTYRGHITVASAFGNEIIARGTAPGEQIDEAIAENLLTELCTATQICLEAVRVTSSTSSTGSQNRFSLARATLGGAQGVPAIRIAAAESTGNITINTDGTCQIATGGSRVANVEVTGAPLVEVARSDSQSIACRGGTLSQTNSSSVATLGGDPVPGLGEACANNVPDQEIDLLLVSIICNADDSSATTPPGDQAPAPYGVRHALDVYVAATLATPLAQVSAAQAESRAVAPAVVPPPPPPPTTTVTTPGPTTTVVTPGPTTTVVVPEDDTAGEDDAGDDGEPAAGAPDDGADGGRPVSLAGDQLPFTGTDVVVLGLAGSLLLAAGLTLRGPARRRELDS